MRYLQSEAGLPPRTEGTAALLLFAFLGISPAFAEDAYRSPQHDLRIQILTEKPKKLLASFYPTFWGRYVDLRGAGCGEPRVYAQINSPVTFGIRSWLQMDGKVTASHEFGMGVKAGLCEDCWICRHCSLGATVSCPGGLPENAFGTKELDLRCTASVSLGVVDVPFPLESKIPLPMWITKPTFVLTDDPHSPFLFEFVNKVKDVWVSLCPSNERPLEVRGGFGGWGDLGNLPNNESQYLQIDALFGAQRFHDFTGADARGKQLTDYFYDEPARTPFAQKDVGISIADSFFGYRKASGEGNGLLGQLLPLRVRGRKSVPFFGPRLVEFEMMLDSAGFSWLPDGSGNQKVILALAATEAEAHFVRKATSGGERRGATLRVHDAGATVTIDKLMLDATNGKIKFRVADFTVNLSLGWFLFSFKMSAGELQGNLNGGEIPIADLFKSFSVEVPDCINTGDPKFMSADTRCYEAGDEEYFNRIKRKLSREATGGQREDNRDCDGHDRSQPRSHTVSVDPTSLEIRRRNDRIHLNFNLLVDAPPALNDMVLSLPSK